MDVAVSVERPLAAQVLSEAQAFLDSIGYSMRWLMAPQAALVVARLGSELLGGIGQNGRRVLGAYRLFKSSG